MAESDAASRFPPVRERKDIDTKQRDLVQKVLEDALQDADITLSTETSEETQGEEEKHSLECEKEQRDVAVRKSTASSLAEVRTVSGTGVQHDTCVSVFSDAFPALREGRLPTGSGWT